ncbi:MAG: serine hydrolase [Planctomycetota bacterium]|nr:serine hydrolase [Planctomycetota bacterium]
MSALLLLPLLAPLTAAPTEDRFEDVRSALAQDVEKGVYRSVVVAVDRGGERLLTHTEGDIAEDAIFRIFSMTKPITAVAALILVDEGKLDLDAPLAEYLPEFAQMQVAVSVKDEETKQRTMQTVDAERAISVRDLFRHTSGLTYGFFGTGHVDQLVQQADLYSGDLEHFSKTLAALPLKHQPGVQFEYSLSCDILGRVVEVVGGKPLDEFFEARIFGPLGMRDTGFSVAKEKLHRIPPLYARQAGELVEQTGGGMPPPQEQPKLFLGGAGLYSSAADYLRFCDMLAHDGELSGTRILKKETVADMFTDHLEQRGGSLLLLGSKFGLGLALVNNDAGPPKGTGWWGGAAGTGFWIDREDKISGVFMIQNMMELRHWHRFQTGVYRALAE